MSSSIPGISPLLPSDRLAPVAAAASVGSGGRDVGQAQASTSFAVHLDTIPATPPAEVRDAMGVAAGAADRLAASGQALHLSLHEQTGRLQATLTDLDGGSPRPVSAAEILHVAAGGTLDPT